MFADVPRQATAADAPEILRVIHAAFSARPPIDPPAAALTEDLPSVETALRHGTGVVVERDGEMLASLLLARDGATVTLSRVSVLPEASGQGLAHLLVEAALYLAADLGARRAELFAREEFPELIDWWRGGGFEIAGAAPHGVIMARELPLVVDVPTAEDMRRLGRRLAALLRRGDVLIATGDLGAGKTTLAQGIGAGLGVDGPIISPTFVLSRIHPNRGDGPSLVHVDAYRLGAAPELADIDLDATLPESVTLVEWGGGIAEWLSPERLEIDILRDTGEDIRTVYLTGVGPRWAGVLDHMEPA